MEIVSLKKTFACQFKETVLKKFHNPFHDYNSIGPKLLVLTHFYLEVLCTVCNCTVLKILLSDFLSQPSRTSSVNSTADLVLFRVF